MQNFLLAYKIFLKFYNKQICSKNLCFRNTIIIIEIIPKFFSKGTISLLLSNFFESSYFSNFPHISQKTIDLFFG
ncbi:unnamed protein product [Blepharisma stoltei]|uniref:Maturase K n=1 Tax=Blepharisma stoltei TaxID=1481888 RepID=A0AAU9JBI9_9CILI|nr:unnamed protein product [Blepharisma stoltei]